MGYGSAVNSRLYDWPRGKISLGQTGDDYKVKEEWQ